MAQRAEWFSAPLFSLDSIPVCFLSKQRRYTGILPIWFRQFLRNQPKKQKKIDISLKNKIFGQFAQLFGSYGCRDPPLLKFDFEFQKNGGKRMDEIHPKRYISSDNPYKIWKTKNNVYWISFHDGEGELHKFTISPELFEAFNSFELEDLSFRNKSDRHHEHVVLNEKEIHQRSAMENRAFEDKAIQQIQFQDFCERIQHLPAIQKRRFLMHYFYGFTFQEIADMEGCTYQPIQRSIYAAKRKLKIFVD